MINIAPTAKESNTCTTHNLGSAIKVDIVTFSCCIFFSSVGQPDPDSWYLSVSSGLPIASVHLLLLLSLSLSSSTFERLRNGLFILVLVRLFAFPFLICQRRAIWDRWRVALFRL